MMTRFLNGILRFCVCVCVFGISTDARAWELGRPVARSSLGEPLLIQVPILAPVDALSTLTVHGASEVTGVLGGVTFSLQDRMIEIRSTTAVTEPFVSMAVELSSPDAHRTVPVTVLLNPPEYRGADDSARAYAAVQSVETPRSGSGARYGPVAPGETLSAIAQSLSADTGATIDQVIGALYEANPGAFQGDVNGLRAGAVLSVPPAAMIRSVATDTTATRMSPPAGGTGAAHAAGPEVARDTVPVDRPALPAAEDRLVPSDRLEALAQRVSALDRHSDALRSQLAERNAQIALLENEIRMQKLSLPPPRAPAVPDAWVVAGLLVCGTLLFFSGAWWGARRADAESYLDPEWRPVLDTDQALAPPSTMSVASELSSAETTVPLAAEDTDADPLGADDVDLELQTRPFAQGDIDFSETDPIDELEAYIAKGQYAQAKTLLGRLINLFPDETNFRVYLLKILHAGREDAAFHEHALYLSERRGKIDDETWEEILLMGGALMPDEALYGGPPPAGTESELPGKGAGHIIEFNSAKQAIQATAASENPVHDMVPVEEKEDVIEFLDDLRKNETAP